MGNASTRVAEEKSEDKVEEGSLETWDDKGTNIGQQTIDGWQSVMDGDG